MLLSEKEMAAALTPVKLRDGARPRSGRRLPAAISEFGQTGVLRVRLVSRSPYQGHARMWHTGSTIGFGTVIERFTKEKLTVIVLCRPNHLDPGKLALQAADILLAAN